jgi:quercetin dioxygenase-like cupin family protein
MDKALFLRNTGRRYHKHPVFQGVQISKLATKGECDSLGVSLIEITPGAEIGPHIHEASLDSIYVLGGEGEAYVNGEWIGISTGDYLLVPEKVEHGIRNNGRDSLTLFVAHAPPLF